MGDLRNASISGKTKRIVTKETEVRPEDRRNSKGIP